MENEENNFLHLSFKISDNSIENFGEKYFENSIVNSFGNFDKNNIIKEIDFDFRINEKSYVFLKNNNQIIIDKTQISEENGENLLFCVRPIKGEYIQIENYFNLIPLKFTEENINSLNYKLWYVIKNYPEENKKDNDNRIEDNINEDYYLCENDIIRLGNFKFILREINLKNYNNDFFINNKYKLKYDIHDINKNNNPVFEFIAKLDFYILEENKNIICSICNDCKCNKDNPIISLCDCDSYKNKHYECLKEEFRQQIKIVKNYKKTSTNYILKCHCY